MDRRTIRTPLMERIMRRVQPQADGCWIYGGAANSVGYGVIGRGGTEGRMVYVHRCTYEHFRGPIPEGLVIDHLCRVRKCCNPDHLEPVTHRTNLLRGVGFSARAARQTHCPQGHPYDEANTYRTARDHRVCRTCQRDFQSRLRARRRAEAVS